jgi:DNA-binding transcriptional ArsR family regulator
VPSPENDAEFLYGLFMSICRKGAEKGFNNISTMKELLRLAMVNVHLEKHADLSPRKANLAAARDLDISVSNVEKCLKGAHKFSDVNPDFINLQQTGWKIIQHLDRTKQRHSFEDLFNRVAHMIHAPEEQQGKALLSTLKKLEETGLIKSELKGGTKYFSISPSLDYKFNIDNFVRLLGLVIHLEAYENVATEPFFRVYYSTREKALVMRRQFDTYIFETIDELDEDDESVQAHASDVQFYYTFCGFGPWDEDRRPAGLADVILKIVKQRFANPASPSMMKTLTCYFTPANAQIAYEKIRNYIEQQGQALGTVKRTSAHHPVVFYLGMTGQNSNV